MDLAPLSNSTGRTIVVCSGRFTRAVSLVSEFVPRGHHGVIGQVNLVLTDPEI